MRKNDSANTKRHPYMRDDLWANGHFDFLWKNASQKFRGRLDIIKYNAMKKLSIQPLNANHA